MIYTTHRSCKHGVNMKEYLILCERVKYKGAALLLLALYLMVKVNVV
jgi:hypothetical protein